MGKMYDSFRVPETGSASSPSLAPSPVFDAEPHAGILAKHEATSLAQLILMVHAGKLHLVYGSYSDATASLHRQWPVATRRSELAQVGEEFEEATPRESG